MYSFIYNLYIALNLQKIYVLILLKFSTYVYFIISAFNNIFYINFYLFLFNRSSVLCSTFVLITQSIKINYDAFKKILNAFLIFLPITSELLINKFCVSFRYQSLVAMYKRMFPDLEVDVKNELARYKVYADKVRPLVRDTVSYMNQSLKQEKKVLVEGANAALLDIDFGKHNSYLKKYRLTVINHRLKHLKKIYKHF